MQALHIGFDLVAESDFVMYIVDSFHLPYYTTAHFVSYRAWKTAQFERILMA